MDTEAFDFVLGTDFFVQRSGIKSWTLQAPDLLYVDHGNGREWLLLEQSEYTFSYLRVSKEEPSNMMAASRTEDYQLLGEVLDQGLKELGYSREVMSVESFASDKQHVLDLYCSKGKNCSYKFYWPSFGIAYGNPRFSELEKVLTKVALERSRMVLCSPDWGVHGGNEYWRTLLDRLTISSVRLPDEAIYVPLGRKTPIGKPRWGSMLSMVDGGPTSIPWESLDSTLVQAIQRESDGLTLGDLKDRLLPQDAIETIRGGDEYVVTNTNAPNSPCHVTVPDGVSECGLFELPCSIHSDDKTEHDAFFVHTCVEEVENAEYVAPLKSPLFMRVEDPVDEELDPRSRLREYVDSKRRLVAKKLCYAKPTRSSWPLKQGRMEDLSQYQDWLRLLPVISLMMNSQESSGTAYLPHELFLRRPVWFLHAPYPEDTNSSSVGEWVQEQQTKVDRAKAMLQRVRERQWNKKNKHQVPASYQEGDWVLVHYSRLPAWPRSTSNDPYFWPYKILSVDGHRITVQCSPHLGGTLVYAAQRLKHYYDPVELCGEELELNDEEIAASDLQGAASPMEVEGDLPDMNAEKMANEGFYLGKSVLCHRYCQGWHFLTLWEGFGVKEAT